MLGVKIYTLYIKDKKCVKSKTAKFMRNNKILQSCDTTVCKI